VTAPEQVKSVVKYLSNRGLIKDLRENPDDALQTVQIYLGADPRDAGKDFPMWIRHLPRSEFERLALDVVKSLGLGAETPAGVVEKLLSEERD